MSTEINFHSNNCEKNINQDKQNEISERMTVEKSESTSKCSEHINKCVELKEDKNAPKDKEENQSQVTYEMLTKKYISRKRKRGKKKKVQKGNGFAIWCHWQLLLWVTLLLHFIMPIIFIFIPILMGFRILMKQHLW